MNGPNTIPDSQLFGVSIRAWTALIIVIAVCYIAVMGRECGEPLYSLSLIVVGMLFAQKPAPRPGVVVPIDPEPEPEPEPKPSVGKP